MPPTMPCQYQDHAPALSHDQAGSSHGLEVRVFGCLLQVGWVEFNGIADILTGRGEVAQQAAITGEIVSDFRIERMNPDGSNPDSAGLMQVPFHPMGVGPEQPPSGFSRSALDQTGADRLKITPLLQSQQNLDPDFDRLVGCRIRALNRFQFLESFSKKSQSDIPSGIPNPRSVGDPLLSHVHAS